MGLTQNKMPNKELEKVLMNKMCNYLARDPVFKENSYTKAFIKKHYEIMSDKDYKFKIRVGNILNPSYIIGCVYDLKKTNEEGTSVEVVYNSVVDDREALRGEEILIDNNIHRKKFGWYIAKSKNGN